MRYAKVLILDDEAQLRSTLVEFLESRGYVPSCAADCRSGVELAAIDQPDLIVLDVDMPRVNGLDALPALHSVAPRAQIIVITGSDTPDLAERSFQRGAFDFLAKPLDYEALDRSLETALSLGVPGA